MINEYAMALLFLAQTLLSVAVLLHIKDIRYQREKIKKLEDKVKILENDLSSTRFQLITGVPRL